MFLIRGSDGLRIKYFSANGELILAFSLLAPIGAFNLLRSVHISPVPVALGVMD